MSEYLTYPGTDSNRSYIEELIRKDRIQDVHRRMNTAIHNPVTGWIHVKDQNYDFDSGKVPWDRYPKVMNANRYQELVAKNAGGQAHANDDQAKYGFYAEEWQDEALRAHSAGVITSTEFPAIMVTSVQNELLRLDVAATAKYNLLSITEVQNTDKIDVVFPEYNDTTKKVRTGYKENDPIETTGYGAFSETHLNLEKSGAGIAFTEEFYLREYKYPIRDILLEGIANDFARVKHERLLTLLPSFADITGADWAAYTPSNMMSDNRPSTDLNAARTAVNSDKVGRANTILSNAAQFTAFEQNTWTSGFGQPAVSSDRTTNDIVRNPRGVPWCEQWVLNEDIANDKAYVLDRKAFLLVQGPRITTTFQNHNPEQTVTIYKDWFKQHLRKAAWGRELISI